MARYAFVVGISQYKNPLKNLEKTTSDAEAVAQILEQCGGFQKVTRLPARFNPDKNTYEMVSRNVTGAELGQALKSFFLERADKSEALIYFTGHGITVSDHLGQQKGYLATSDCIIEAQGNEIVEQQHGIALDSLNDLIRSSNLSSLVLLLDCCHGGYFLERNLVEQTLTTFSSQKDYYLITACRGFEQAWAIKTEQHDVFTGALLKGLAAENAGRDGRISGDRLFDYINAELQGSRQEPIRMGWGRSITLVTHTLQQSIAVSTEFRQENPYQGLQAFESEQEAYFCGREQAIWALLGRLTTNRFVAVIGPSGCGKSSLVRAGLLPQLGRDRLPGSSHWDTEIFTPGKHPLEKLMEILNRRHQKNQPFVLFIDQFEELFTLCEDNAERWNFIRLMAEEATGSERMTRVIVAIRAAFLEQCAPYPEAAELINQARPTTYIVPPLTFPELEAAIEHPASLHGVRFERGLVSQIANDVADRPGALPLMQYALMELWRVCIQASSSPQPVLTLQGYQEIGGVRGALEKRANLLYQSFSLEDQAFIRRLFLELVQLNEGGEVTRRRINWSDLEAIADSPEQLGRVTRLLSGQQQRLIITSDKIVEVAHEALFSEWKLLHDWIEENREDIQINRRLEAACREWQETYQQSDDALLTGAPLAAIEAWANKSQPKLPPQEAEFLQKSIEKRDRQLLAQIEQERRLREEAEARAKAETQKTQMSIMGGILIAFTLSFGLLAQQREQQARQSESFNIGSLVESSKQSFDSGYQLEALMTSIKALKRIKSTGVEPPSAMETLQPIVNGIQEKNRLRRGEAEITRLSFSPDGSLVAAASKDGSVRVWTQNGEFFKLIPASRKAINSISFSPDGNLIAVAGKDRIVRLWSQQKQSLEELKEKHKDTIWRVAFSPISQLLASASYDGTINLWDKDGEYLNSINVNGGQVYGVSFSRDEAVVASGSRDGKLKLWTKGGKLVKQLQADDVAVYDIAFSPDGKTVASVGTDQAIKLWIKKDASWQSLSFWKALKGHKDSIYSVDFSRSGKLISGSGDETIKIWDIESNSSNALNCRGFVNDAKFSSQGDLVACATNEVILWNVYPNLNKDENLDNVIKNSCEWLRNYLSANQVEGKQVCE